MTAANTWTWSASERHNPALQVRSLPKLRAMMIDNYDSFTFNLVQYFQMLGMDVETKRNDELSVADVVAAKPDFVILSPGPSDPSNAGICLEMIAKAAEQKIPLLGVCLGHQAIGQAFGGNVIRAPIPIHGKTDRVSHSGDGMFRDLPKEIEVTRYHSLVVEASTLPQDFAVTAKTADGLVMGLRHKHLPIEGIQFHPESVLTEYGLAMLANFIRTHVSQSGAKV